MSRRNLNRYLIIIFIAGFFSFLIIKNIERPRILVLHSYHEEYQWVRYINEGMDRVFSAKNYNIKRYYMNTKRNPQEEYKKKAGLRARKVIERWNPNIIIAIDDDAQKYLSDYYIAHKEINVIFSGVNAKPEKYGYLGAENVTGIKERINFSAVKKALSHLMEGKTQLYQISDDSRTTALIRSQIEEASWAPFELLEGRRCKTFDDWKEAIDEANQNADVILISLYHTIKESDKENAKVVDPKKIIEYTEDNIEIPVIGLWGMYVEDGGMFSIAVSGFEQGEVPARMAIDIIENKKKPSDIPIKDNDQFLVYMREKELMFHEVQVPEIYKAFAHATDTYFE